MCEKRQVVYRKILFQQSYNTGQGHGQDLNVVVHSDFTCSKYAALFLQCMHNMFWMHNPPGTVVMALQGRGRSVCSFAAAVQSIPAQSEEDSISWDEMHPKKRKKATRVSRTARQVVPIRLQLSLPTLCVPSRRIVVHMESESSGAKGLQSVNLVNSSWQQKRTTSSEATYRDLY